jgi:bacterioferritin
MIREDLIAERIAIESYRALVQFLGNDDPTTRSLVESILAMEEQNADDAPSARESERRAPLSAGDSGGLHPLG